ncbi:MAG: hypothetical protein Q7V88_06925 [Actinomycetota bacterium]|nr:hypothetical protein [Actinomycetota bacterium]
MDTEGEQLSELRDERARLVARLVRAEQQLAAERVRRLATLQELDAARASTATALAAAAAARDLLRNWWAGEPASPSGALTEDSLVCRVARSGLFDAQWYLATYPDVAVAGVQPATHFVCHGAAEGRSGGPAFDDAYYLAANPDVAAAGLHPLLHFLQSGCLEGRLPRPVAPAAAEP